MIATRNIPEEDSPGVAGESMTLIVKPRNCWRVHGAASESTVNVEEIRASPYYTD